jgi:excisionase family DNA binding protein
MDKKSGMRGGQCPHCGGALPRATIAAAPLAYSVDGARWAAGNVSRTVFYEWIASGHIEARRCGGRTLIPAASLQHFLDSLPPAPIGKASAASASGGDRSA